MHTFALFLSVDGHRRASVGSRAEMQQQSMVKALCVESYEKHGIWNDLVSNELDREGCCRWNGVRCEQGIVTALEIQQPTSSSMGSPALRLGWGWLPHTIAHLEVQRALLAHKFDI